MDRLWAGISSIVAKGCVFVGAVFLVATMLLLVGNAFGRTFLQTPIFLTLDTAGLLASVGAGAGMVFATMEGANITLRLLVERIPRRVATCLAVFSGLLSMGAVGYLEWTLVDLVAYAARTGEKTVIAGVPLVYFKIAFFLAMFLVGVWLVRDLVASLRKGREA